MLFFFFCSFTAMSSALQLFYDYMIRLCTYSSQRLYLILHLQSCCDVSPAEFGLTGCSHSKDSSSSNETVKMEICVSLTLVAMILSCHRFEVIGYGCATCVGNTSPLPKPVVDTIKQVSASSENPSHVRIKFACQEVQISSASCVSGGPGGLWHSIWQQALRRPPVRLRACQLPGLAPAGGGVRACRDHGHRLRGGASW